MIEIFGGTASRGKYDPQDLFIKLLRIDPPSPHVSLGGTGLSTYLSEPFNHDLLFGNQTLSRSDATLSFRRQRLVGPDAMAFPATNSMHFIVSETTDLLSTTWRASHFRGCIWHALTQGKQETITPFPPFGGAGIKWARLNMFAAPCRAPTMLVGRYHRSRLPPLLMLMRPADL